MADIILVQPKLGGYGNLIDPPFLPLSLLSISSFLHKDYDIKIIDQRIDKNWKKHLLRGLNQNPLCVGLTSMTGKQIKYALGISKLVRQNSDIPVVWGGVHASLLPRQTLENGNINFVIEGEGERSFYELVNSLDKGKSVNGIKGVWYKKNDGIRKNPKGNLTDLNKLPEIPYHLINVKNYLQKINKRKSIILQTSRGCPFNCSFCINKAYYNSCWRSFSYERIRYMIKYVVDSFKVKNIWFVDDNFFVSLKRTKNIAKEIITEKYDLTYDILGAHLSLLNKADHKHIRLLEKSGCRKLYFGIESGSPKILNKINKNISILPDKNFFRFSGNNPNNNMLLL